MRRFLPYFIIAFSLLAFSKFMSVLNSKTGIFDMKMIHAENKEQEVQKEQESDKPPAKVEIKDQHGIIMGEVYNIDTSQIQKINTCEKLYDLNFSPEEVQVLQTLRHRNEKLNEIENDLKLKEDMLRSIQQAIENKLDELTKLHSQIDDDKTSDYSQSYSKLVKIYEGMKPKEAAKIFNTLQTQVLLGVAQQMKENKLAAIVAEMNPEKARDLTMSLATTSTD